MQSRVIEHARDDLGATDDPRKAMVAAGPPKQTLWDKVADHFIDRIVPEVGDMLMQKTAQGAAEMAQGLNGQSNFYVPYGSAQKPLEVEGPATAWANELHNASQRGYGQEQQMER
jgi:hypothetical protein